MKRCFIQGFMVALLFVQGAVFAEVSINICINADGYATDCPESPGSPPGSPSNGVPLLGTPIDSLGLCSNESGSWHCTNLPMKTSDSGNLASCKPGQWSSPDVPPSSTSTVARYRISGKPELYDSKEQACSGGVPIYWPSDYACWNGVSCIRYSAPSCGGNYISSVPIVVAQECPSGYVLSGGLCVMSDAASVKWPSDGKCCAQRSGDTWVQASRDSDCATPGGGTVTTEFGCEHSGPEVTCRGSDGSRARAELGLDAGGTGRGKITDYTPNSDGITSRKKEVTIGTPMALPPSGGFPGGTMGKIDGYGEGTVQGTGEMLGGGAGNSGGGDGDTNLDTAGLAKDTTVQGLGDKLEGIKDAIEGESGGESWSSGEGTEHDPVDKSPEIEQARQDLEAEFALIREELSGMFSASLSETAYSCDSSVSLDQLGVEVGFCFSDYADIFATIGQGVLLAAALLSLYIILG